MATDFLMGKWQVFPDDCHVFDGKRRIKLEPKAMDLLVVLAKADGQLVSRDDIFSMVWKNQIIADHVLYNLIANLRKVFEEMRIAGELHADAGNSVQSTGSKRGNVQNNALDRLGWAVVRL